MLSNIVAAGDRIELRKIDTSMQKSSSAVNDKAYLSKVYDVLSEERLMIAMPMEEGRIVPLELNSKYEVFFIASKGFYSCMAEVVDRYKQNTLYILVINVISSLKKHQRRQYFRLECLLDFKFRILEIEELEALKKKMDGIIDEEKFSDATALDISGGGMRFTSAEKLNVNQNIHIVLDTEMCHISHRFEILANVKYTDGVKNREKLYEARVEFIDFETKNRELLIKYIFECDRIHRKRV